MYAFDRKIKMALNFWADSSTMVNLEHVEVIELKGMVVFYSFFSGKSISINHSSESEAQDKLLEANDRISVRNQNMLNHCA